MLNRSYVVILVLMVTLVVLAACGGDSEATAVPATPTSEVRVAVQTMDEPADQSTVVQETATLAPTVASEDVQNTPVVEAMLVTADVGLSTVNVVKILKPSVVHILTESSAMGSFNQPGPSTGVGTGVILDEEGNILTNNHVIAGAQSILVTLANGDSFPAQLIGGDVSTDTAVIRIDADGLKPAKLGHSAELQVGEDVIAIGHALALPGGPTVSKGVVSAVGRSIDIDQRTTMVDLIQTDASINPGNSGGPLSNVNGEVIGINSAGIPGSQNIGFAINIDDAKIVVAHLLEKGYVDRGFLGITPISLSPAIASQVGVPVNQGVLIVRVVPDSAAAGAGIQPEDVIVQLGEDMIANTGELSKFLVDHPPSDTVDVVFYRRDQEISTRLTLGERPQP